MTDKLIDSAPPLMGTNHRASNGEGLLQGSRPTVPEGLTTDELAMLRWYSPDTYTIALPFSEERRSLEKRGLIDWRGNFLGSNHYALTDAGRDALAKAGG